MCSLHSSEANASCSVKPMHNSLVTKVVDEISDLLQTSQKVSNAHFRGVELQTSEPCLQIDGVLDNL